ncbi:PilN domain-containing protein [Pseudorhodoferax sp. Leaf267]|uniref:PilN domain-containing protein n=1 Tax=Pseudorhodoferax sp. Leaf267 TaxID=1736316 RepID=UPI0006F8085A|nr:PilN domain-containing protein [Pseudorhodoferax sp. Leaf267]KQP12650.1 hypothetical protein ASF43_20650 [Pseudorhodoferax sp. Leaf267]
MAAPDLDFLPPSPLARWWGHGVLALGVAACGWAALRYVQADEARTAALAQLQPAASRAQAAAPVPRELQAEIDAAQAVAATLAVPWDAWFRALESVAVPGVHLTALQPEAAGRRVRIAGQAGDLQQALAYVDALERTPGFARVLLADHAVQEGAMPAQLRFTLTAEWGVP